MRFATSAMATRFEIVIDASPSAHLQSVGELAIAEIERLHSLLSRFDPSSLLSHINRTASHAAVRVDAETFRLLQDARDVWQRSGGAFDPARGSGMSRVILDADSRTIRFDGGGIDLDLGAIAKGHAVQRAADMLREHGVERAFVHGGTSSVAAVGAPHDEARGWRVTLAPAQQTTFYLRDEALSASSSALRDHIIDPATRAPAQSVRTAAVVGPCARLADAWSTALVVLRKRPEQLGLEWKVCIE